MIILRQMLGGDVEPRVMCEVCEQLVSLSSAWLAFPAVSLKMPLSVGRWVHRPCTDGEALRIFGTKHLVLWRGRDLLLNLLAKGE